MEQLTRQELSKIQDMLGDYLEIQENINYEYYDEDDQRQIQEDSRFYKELSKKIDRILGGK